MENGGAACIVSHLKNDVQAGNHLSPINWLSLHNGLLNAKKVRAVFREPSRVLFKRKKSWMSARLINRPVC